MKLTPENLKKLKVGRYNLSRKLSTGEIEKNFLEVVTKKKVILLEKI